MSERGTPQVGRSLLRREDRRLLTGAGQFIADLELPRMLDAAFVRSPAAHAHIRSVDLSRAAVMPGVALALSGADVLRLLPPVPDAQLSLPGKWTSLAQHEFTIRSSRSWHMTRCAMSAKRSPSLSRRTAIWPKTPPRW
jgi:CO/xanthine dehydrogenase Mo-binding subunit